MLVTVLVRCTISSDPSSFVTERRERGVLPQRQDSVILYLQTGRHAIRIKKAETFGVVPCGFAGGEVEHDVE